MKDSTVDIRDLLSVKVWDGSLWSFGYYMCHTLKTPSAISNGEEKPDKADLLVFSGFSDWNMPKPLQATDIDRNTVCISVGIGCENAKLVYTNDICTHGDSKMKVVYNVQTLSFGLVSVDSDSTSDFIPLSNFVNMCDGKPCLDLRVVGNVLAGN